MKKKLIVLLVAIIAVSAITVSVVIHNKADVPKDENGSSLNIEVTSKKKDKTPAIDIDWKEFSFEQEGGGYKTETKIKFSPWVRYDDEKTRDAIWSTISNGNNLIDSPLYPGGRVLVTMGTIEHINKTPGFDITEESSIGVGLDYYINIPPGSYNSKRCSLVVWEDGSIEEYKTKGDIDSFAIFSGGYTGLPRQKMTSNNYGPTPFIMFVRQEVNPENPNGTPDASEILLKITPDSYDNATEFSLSTDLLNQ